MNPQAFRADIVQESSRITGENLADGGENQQGVQLADAGNQLLRSATPARRLNRLDGLARAFDAIADSVGKVPVKEEKLENAIGRDIGRIDLAVGLKRGAAAQQPDQLKVEMASPLLGRARSKSG